MGRPAVTKGDIKRAVEGAIDSGGLRAGEIEVRVEGNVLRILPCRPVRPQDDLEPNPWDDDE